MVAPDFIVPPPGLIPNTPEQPALPAPPPERTVRAPARVLPTFTPVPAGPPGSSEPPTSPVIAVPPAPTATPTPTPLAPATDESVPDVFRLVGDHGFEVLLTAVIVVGRDPIPDAAHADARPITLVDPARSVSKTHAVIDARSGAVMVTDLHSTNGVRVQPASGGFVDLVPGDPTEVAVGSTMLLGELGLRVDRVPAHTV